MPDRVVSAALTQLCLVGPDALTIEAIAERAHVSAGFIYKHFGSLSDVLRDALLDGLSAHLAAIPREGPLTAGLLLEMSTHDHDRLPLEAILSLRRFPEIREIVGPATTELVERIGPMRSCVVFGCHAVAIAGVSPAESDVTALIALEYRIQGGDIRNVESVAPEESVGDLSIPHPPPLRNDPTTVRLRAAASQLLTETAGQATIRDIATKAGVTTGAVYRRYESKDDLIGDTIQARVTEDRTTWLMDFFEVLTNPGTGDPARVLSDVLAEASETTKASTRESIELLISARGGPAARMALASRYTSAIATRTAQLTRFRGSALMRHEDSPAALAWAFQVVPMGARILGLATQMPDSTGWYPSMVSLLRAL
ncbi:MAG: TetR/AcrR family transcriptional regulator [Actinomycetota bacterium]